MAPNARSTPIVTPTVTPTHGCPRLVGLVVVRALLLYTAGKAIKTGFRGY